MDLLSLHNSRWLILKSTRRLTNALNKAATIIPKPRLTRPRLRSGRPNVALPHATSPLPSGSTNTVGQALAQLSSSTSDTAPPKRYDLYWGSFGELPAPFKPMETPARGGTKFWFTGKNVYTRSTFAEIRLERLLFRTHSRARLLLRLWCAILFSQPFPASLTRKATIPQ